MSTAVATAENTAVQQPSSHQLPGDVLESIARGDLSKLDGAGKAQIMVRVCESLGLNPLTSPFAFLKNKKTGEVMLYARKEATEQLRKLHNVSIEIVGREVMAGDVYQVVARAKLPARKGTVGRSDESIGAVCLTGLQGDDRANALMKAETKAKRRVTLSICGLGFLDETELQPFHETIEATIQQPQALPAPAPVAIATNGQTQTEPNTPLTPEQAQKIDDLVTELKITPEQFSSRLIQVVGFGDWHNLTATQATKVLALLEARKAQVAAKGAA
jgi:hypothetical protein